MSPRPFEPRGPLALEPSAFGMLLMSAFEAPANQRVGDVAIVTIRGPLMHHADLFCDSYDGIRDRVTAALEEAPRALVLRLDSPGGLVAGCFDTASQIRAQAAAAGIPVIAVVEGGACSAAYALACAASKVIVSPTGMVGSIGIIDSIVDATAAAAQQGVRVTVIGSGDRKADGNPMRAVTPEAIEAAQARVRSLAEVFFAHVAAARPALSVDAARALEARVAHGAEAVALGLADEVGTLSELLASIASSASPASAGGGVQMDEEEKARKALQAIVDDEKTDAKAKAKARRALAAMDEDEDEEPAAKAEGDAPPPEKKGDEEEARARASAAPTASATVDIDAKIAAAFRERDEQAERAQLLASRPDLDETTKDILASAPIAKVREAVKKLPRRALNPAAAANVTTTRGEGQGGDASTIGSDDPELAAIDRAMGLVSTTTPKAERRGNILYLGRAPADAPQG